MGSRIVRILVAAVFAVGLFGGVAGAQYPPGGGGGPAPSPTPPFVPAPGPPQIRIETPGAVIIIEGRNFGERPATPPVTVIRKGGQSTQAAVHTADVADDGSFTLSVPAPEGPGELTVAVAGLGRDGTIHLLQGGPGDVVLSPSRAQRADLLAAGIDEETLAAMGFAASSTSWLYVALALGLVLATGLGALLRRQPTHR